MYDTGYIRQYGAIMQRLTEIILERVPHGVFTHTEVALLAGGSPDRVYSLVKRAIRAGEILHIRRGFYCLAPKYLRHSLSVMALAQRLRGPSYISLESALSRHGVIPEAVHTIVSVCDKRSCTFDTPVGRFQYVRVPQRTLYEQVERVVEPDGEAVFLASPAKALADYVYARRLNWTSAEPLVGSLRIEPDRLTEIDTVDIDALLANYDSRRVQRFLKGLKKELA